MCSKGLLKRFAPFFIALALGLFAASFFVAVGLPNVRFNRGFRNQHREYHRRLEYENQRLKEENFRLKSEAAQENARRSYNAVEDINDLVPPPPPIPARNFSQRR